MASANKTKVLKLPQYLGNEYMHREDWNEAFRNIEEAVVSFDYLCDTYGYNLLISEEDGNKVFSYSVKEGCPYTATKKVTKSIVDGVKQFRSEINIDGTIIIFVNKKTESGWEGSVE